MKTSINQLIRQCGLNLTLLFVLSFVLIGQSLAGVTPLPDQPGPYQVGFVDIKLANDPGGENAGHGLWAAVCYPRDAASMGDVVGYPIMQLDFLESLGLANESRLPSLLGAIENAPLAEGQFPLIVLLHGNGDGRFRYMTMCEQLASHGFIVGIPDVRAATIEDLLTIFLNITDRDTCDEASALCRVAKAIPEDEFPLPCFTDSTKTGTSCYPFSVKMPGGNESTRLTIDKIKALSEDSNSIFYQKAITDNVGLIGHSIGESYALSSILQTVPDFFENEFGIPSPPVIPEIQAFATMADTFILNELAFGVNFMENSTIDIPVLVTTCTNDFIPPQFKYLLFNQLPSTPRALVEFGCSLNSSHADYCQMLQAAQTTVNTQPMPATSIDALFLEDHIDAYDNGTDLNSCSLDQLAGTGVMKNESNLDANTAQYVMRLYLTSFFRVHIVGDGGYNSYFVEKSYDDEQNGVLNVPIDVTIRGGKAVVQEKD